MGLNGTFSYVAAQADTTERLPRAIERFFVAAGAVLVSREVLSFAAQRDDTRLFGIAVLPPVAGWIALVDTERSPNVELARYLADNLSTPTVITQIAEICDPPEPEALTVFGTAATEHVEGLWERVGSVRYSDLLDSMQRYQFAGGLPFDATQVEYLTFRALTNVRPTATEADDTGAPPPF